MEFIKCDKCGRTMHPYLVTSGATLYRCTCGNTVEVKAKKGFRTWLTLIS